jgi:formate transporter
MLIVFLGAELFTGNTMFFTVGALSRQVPITKYVHNCSRITIRLFYNWIIVYFSNFAGCVAGAYFFGHLTQLVHGDPWASYIRGVTK